MLEKGFPDQKLCSIYLPLPTLPFLVKCWNPIFYCFKAGWAYSQEARDSYP